MNAVTVDNAKRNRRITYLVLALIFVILAGTALFTFSSAHRSAEADQKADQLITELTAAGLRAPSKEQIVNVLGADGGTMCTDPTGTLRRGILYGMITNGAGGPGARPVIADNKVLQGQLLAIKVYCPQWLDEFQKVVDDLKTADVAKD
jgi:Tfp pilus assembly protein FimT